MSALVEAERFLADEDATIAFGQALGEQLARDGAVVFLGGQLGAGKTTLSRGILRAFHYSGPVKSPTYTLVEPYDVSPRPVFHFDLYRLADPEELEYLGVREYFEADAVVLVEWAQNGRGFLPPPDIDANFTVQDFGRNLQLKARSERGRDIVAALKRQLV